MANVAHLSALEARCLSYHGSARGSRPGHRLRALIERQGVDCEGDVTDPGRRTAVKQRLRCDDQLVARFEEGDVGPIGAKLTARLAAALTAAAECHQSLSHRAQCKRLPSVSRRLDRGMRPL